MFQPVPDNDDSSTRPQDLIIRDARPEEAAIIAELVRELAQSEGEVSGVDEPTVREYLGFPLSGALIAELGGEIVGLLTWFVRPGLYHGGRWGYIDELIVRKHTRRRGVADALMAEVMRRFQQLGCREAAVSMTAGNEPARALYTKHGLVDEAVFLERHFER